jgi:hypothetical protein
MKAPNPRPKPTRRSIDRNLLELPLETALKNLRVQARSLLAESGHVESLKSRFRALCLQVLSLHHKLQVEQALSLAERLWSDSLRQDLVSKKREKLRSKSQTLNSLITKRGMIGYLTIHWNYTTTTRCLLKAPPLCC